MEKIVGSPVLCSLFRSSPPYAKLAQGLFVFRRPGRVTKRAVWLCAGYDRMHIAENSSGVLSRESAASSRSAEPVNYLAGIRHYHQVIWTAIAAPCIWVSMRLFSWVPACAQGQLSHPPQCRRQPCAWFHICLRMSPLVVSSSGHAALIAMSEGKGFSVFHPLELAVTGDFCKEQLAIVPEQMPNCHQAFESFSKGHGSKAQPSSAWRTCRSVLANEGGRIPGRSQVSESQGKQAVCCPSAQRLPALC